MVQIYLMRRLLETELLRTIFSGRTPNSCRCSSTSGSRPPNVCATATSRSGMHSSTVSTRQLYALSPLDVVHAEVERLWLLSNVYRLVGFEFHQPERKSFAIGYYRAC